MQLIHGLRNLAKPLPGSVVTLGNFDGVHLGHQALLNELKHQSKIMGVPTVVISFEPQPKEFFAKHETVPRLTRWREKFLALARYGIDYFCCLRFDEQLANLSAQDFVETILLAKLNMRAAVIGYDFQFGKDRDGDVQLLQRMGQQYHFKVIQVPAVLVENEPVSSTRIRAALQQGNLELVSELLGRPFSFCGKVIYGQQRGRDLGFPTANINLKRELVPLSGVFIIKAKIDGQIFNGVANVGMRPTFNGTGVLLEAHLFDFKQVIYGRNIEVQFLKRIRPEKKFENFEALKAQIHKDAEEASNYFAKDKRL